MNVKPPSLVPQRTSFPRMSRLRRVLTVFLIVMSGSVILAAGVPEGWMIAGKPTRQVRSRGRYNSSLRRPAERLPEVEAASDGQRLEEIRGRTGRASGCDRYFLGSCLTVREHLAQRSEIRSCGRADVSTTGIRPKAPGVRPGRSGFSAAIKSAIQAVIRSAGLQ